MYPQVYVGNGENCVCLSFAIMRERGEKEEREREREREREERENSPFLSLHAKCEWQQLFWDEAAC